MSPDNKKPYESGPRPYWAMYYRIREAVTQARLSKVLTNERRRYICNIIGQDLAQLVILGPRMKMHTNLAQRIFKIEFSYKKIIEFLSY